MTLGSGQLLIYGSRFNPSRVIRPFSKWAENRSLLLAGLRAFFARLLAPREGRVVDRM